MIVLELHPEDLLERQRWGGVLTGPERSRLGTHLTTCVACRFTCRVGRDFDQEVPHDWLGGEAFETADETADETIDRWVAAALTHLPVPAPVKRPSNGRGRRCRGILVATAVGSLLLLAGVAAAVQRVDVIHILGGSLTGVGSNQCRTPRR